MMYGPTFLMFGDRLPQAALNIQCRVEALVNCNVLLNGDKLSVDVSIQ